MKRKNWKRTAAFVTSLTMATTMMPAELGSVLVRAMDSAIVVKNDDMSLTGNTFEPGDYFETDVEFNKADTFSGNIIVDYSSARVNSQSIADGENIEGGFNAANIKSIKYETVDGSGAPKDPVLIIVDNSGNKATFNTKYTVNKDELNKESKKSFFSISSCVVNGSNVNITIERKEAVDEYKITYSSVRKVIKSISYVNNDTGNVTTLNSDAVSAGSTVDVKAKKQVVITSSTLLKDAGNKNLTPYLSGEPGNYVYTFNALDNLELTALNNNIIIDDASVEGYEYKVKDEKDKEINLNNIPVGSKITIESNKKFTITEGAIKSIDSEGKVELEDVTSAYSDTKWRATFYAVGGVIKFEDHVHKLSYSDKGTNELIAKCDENDLDSETVAKVWAELAPAKDGDKPSEIANNGKIYYGDEATLKFGWDANLLGVSGSNAAQAIDKNLVSRTVLKKDDVEFTIRVYKAETEDAPEIQGKKEYLDGDNKVVITTKAVVNGETVTTTLENRETGKEYYYVNKDKPANIDDLVIIGPSTITVNKEIAAKAGTFDASLTVWETDVDASSKTLTYKYTTAPSEQIKESDIKVYAAYTGKLGSTAKYDKDDFNGDNANVKDTIISPVSVADLSYNVSVIKYRLENNNNSPKITKAYINAIDDLNAYIKEHALPTEKKDGVFEISATEDGIKANDNVTAIFEVEDSKAIALNAANAAWNKANNHTGENDPDKLRTDYPETFILDTDYVLAGSSVTNIIDPEAPQLMKVKIVNPDYKSEEFKVNWKLVTAVEKDGISFTGTKDNDNFVTANSKPAQIENVVKAALKTTGDIDRDKITFWYSLNKPTNNYDIDDRYEGLPKPVNANAEITYYVYAVYSDEIFTETPLKLVVSNNVANDQRVEVVPVLSKTEFTYGDKITADDVSFTAANGDTKVKATQVGFTVIAGLDDNGGIIDLGYTGAVTDLSNLAPGKYRVKAVDALKYDGNPNDNGKTGLELISYGDCFKFADNQYKISANAPAYDIVITKRSLDKSMVGDIIKEKGTKTSVSITNNDVTNATTGINKDGLKLRLTGVGVNTEYQAGTYTAQVAPTNDFVKENTVLGNNIRYSDLYDGTLDIQWYIINKASERDFALSCDGDASNIYKDKNGVQLHIEAKMLVKDNQNNFVAADKDSKKDTVTYGFVYSKSSDANSIPKDAKPNDLKNSFRLDNGYGATNAVKKNTDGCVTGVNMVVKSIDDYVWVRPYATVNGGAPVYGEPKMYCFEDIAKDVVKPELAPVELVNKKDSKGNENLYYWVYATKADRVDNTDNTNVLRTAEPDKWGVVISREGNYKSPTNNSVEKAFDYENLTLENCDAASTAVDNASYNKFESGTLLRITDSRSRVYVRTYADFGNGLVVYSDLNPAYADNDDEATKIGKYNTALITKSIDSVSDTLCTAFEIGTAYKADTADGKNRLYMSVVRKDFPAVAPDSVAVAVRINTKADFTSKTGKVQKFEDIVLDNKDNGLTSMGLVIDKNGAYDSTKHELVATENKTFKVVTATAGINGHADLGENRNDMFSMSAVTTPVNGIKVSFRGFVEYKGVKLYTNVRTVQVTDNFSSEIPSTPVDWKIWQ